MPTAMPGHEGTWLTALFYLGHIGLSTNTAERSRKQLALNRKNASITDSDTGGIK